MSKNIANSIQDLSIYKKAVHDFGDWIKQQIVGVDNSTKEIIVVRNDRWEDAIDTFLNEIKRT